MFSGVNAKGEASQDQTVIQPEPQTEEVAIEATSAAPVKSDSTDESTTTENSGQADISTKDEDEGKPTPEVADNQQEADRPDTISIDSEPEPEAEPFSLLNSLVAPNSFRTLHWSPGFSMSSINTPVPVLVAHGAQPGPVLCLTAAIHGDELNGIEIVRRILHQLEPAKLNGTVIGIPIVNLDGFRRTSRYLTDRRDLNRFFPGNPEGSYASRVAYSLFQQVIKNCEFLVDVHTGSMKRENLPQLRGDLKNPAILEFTRHFGGMSVLHHAGGPGTLRRSASDYGIPAITMETGGPHALEKQAVDNGVKGVKNMLHNLAMYKTLRLWSIPQPVYYQSMWIRSNQGGILLSKAKLDQTVSAGDMLGQVVDPITNTSSDILAPIDGRVLGKAIDQVISPGFATFHLGVIANQDELSKPLPKNEAEADEESPAVPSTDESKKPAIAPPVSTVREPDLDG